MFAEKSSATIALAAAAFCNCHNTEVLPHVSKGSTQEVKGLIHLFLVYIRFGSKEMVLYNRVFNGSLVSSFANIQQNSFPKGCLPLKTSFILLGTTGYPVC